jgi:tetratricopeptide (TPR) repeat protein
LLVVLSGCLWLLTGFLPLIAIAFLPWVIRLIADSFPFRRTSLDWFVLLFLGTSWLGYWAAYDQEAAWIKVWLILLAVLLYYALASQPAENFAWISIFFFCIGVGVSTYFFLTLVIGPSLPPVHQNYAAGIAAVTTPFILYPIRQRIDKRYSVFFRVFALLGSGVALLAILAATSRGILMAMVSVCGAWIIWQVINRNRRWTWIQNKSVFPSLVILYLCAIVLFLYIGPANLGYVSTDYPYGTGSRAELIARSLYLVSDYPFTGGGLGAFPGLYSNYLLGIPFFNVPNSHNLFLDVAIEQGVLGGLSYLIVFLASIWIIAKNVAGAYPRPAPLFQWLTLSALLIAFVHGLVDNYLYNGSGSLLALALAGASSAIQSRTVRPLQLRNYSILGLAVVVLALLVVLNLRGLQARWYANLGAVQMAKVELKGFPTNQWTDPAIVLQLDQADATLRSALQLDQDNRTANHRLGLISMLRGDFTAGAAFLEKAHAEAPNHRGITKSLGYCYVWLGDTEKALSLLSQIPEAKEELEIYVWWLGEHGQPDLTEKAAQFLSSLELLSAQK